MPTLYIQCVIILNAPTYMYGGAFYMCCNFVIFSSYLVASKGNELNILSLEDGVPNLDIDYRRLFFLEVLIEGTVTAMVLSSSKRRDRKGVSQTFGK